MHLLNRRRQWHPTPVLLPGKSHGRRSLEGCSPWGHKESDMTEWLHFHFSLSCIGEGNGNPLQCSWLENPRDGGAWWAAIYGVVQSRTRLKRLSSSSSICSLGQPSRYGPIQTPCTSLTSVRSSSLLYPQLSPPKLTSSQNTVLVQCDSFNKTLNKFQLIYSFNPQLSVKHLLCTKALGTQLWTSPNFLVCLL